MRKMIAFLALAVSVMLSPQVKADLATYTYNFGTTSANAGVTSSTGAIPNVLLSNFTIGNSFSSGTINAITNTSQTSGGSSSSGQMNIQNAFRTGVLNTSTTAGTPDTRSGFYQFTITNNSNLIVSLTDFNFWTRSTGTGPNTYSLRRSSDSFASDIFSVNFATNSTWTNLDNSFGAIVLASGPTIFRLYGYGGSGNATSGNPNGRIDDVSITLSAVPEPGTLARIGILAALVSFHRRRFSFASLFASRGMPALA